MVAPAFKPLNIKRAGIATAGHRSSTGPLPPIPKTRPAPVVSRAKPVVAAGGDTAMLRNVQGMSEGEFRDYIGHLARVWSWGRAQQMVVEAVGGNAQSEGAEPLLAKLPLD